MRNIGNGTKTIIGAIFGVIFAALGFHLTNRLIYGSPESALKEEMDKYNKQLPQKLDAYSVLDSVSMPSSMIVNYHITVDVLKEEVDYDSVKENIVPNLLNNAKNEAGLHSFRKMKITLLYKYYDNNGDIFFEYAITPEMYQ
ncbi:hypothetical protein [Dysgonomonas termitidis]|uniref:Uncharacterized protein n=1 Tax=Dysgonomonas termitidis TaxID=1516126 RepID=A0ABV9KRB5_9BACT